MQLLAYKQVGHPYHKRAATEVKAGGSREVLRVSVVGSGEHVYARDDSSNTLPCFLEWVPLQGVYPIMNLAGKILGLPSWKTWLLAWESSVRRSSAQP
jgi:hypothetical protein